MISYSKSTVMKKLTLSLNLALMSIIILLFQSVLSATRFTQQVMSPVSAIGMTLCDCFLVSLSR